MSGGARWRRLAAVKYSEARHASASSDAAVSMSGASACMRVSVKRTLGPATLTTPTTPWLTGCRIAAAMAEIPGAELSATQA